MAGSRKSISRLLDRHKTVLGREMDPTNSHVLSHLVKRGVLNPEEQSLLLSERNYAARGEMFVDLFSRKGFNAFREFCITLELECPHLLTSLLLDSTARLVLFGGTNLEEESDRLTPLYQPSPCLRSRPPQFPSPSRPRPRSVAPEYQRRSANFDYREIMAYNPGSTLPRHMPSYEVRGHTQERCYSVAESLGVSHSRENSLASVIFSMSPKCDNRELEMHRSPSANSVLSNGAMGYGFGMGPPVPGSDPPTPTGHNGGGKLVKEKFEDVHELLEEPVEEQGGERIVWEYHNVILERVPGYGFGIAVSGGRDNPHFTNGDPSIAISDVLKAGPAEGKLLINDRVISANGISLEGVDYATAVQVLRDSGQTVSLVVKRRVVLPPAVQTTSNANTLTTSTEPKSLRISLSRNKKKEDFGVVLGCKIYIKEITSRTVADKDGCLQEGDLICKINGSNIDGLTLKEARSLIEKSKDKLELIVKRTGADKPQVNRPNLSHAGMNGGDVPAKHNYAPQNLYVQPPVNGIDEKNNLARAIYSSSMVGNGDQLADGSLGAPPRPPPPQDDDYGTSSRHGGPSTNEDSLTDRTKGNLPDPRFISFQKNGSVGIRLTGGNEVGIFVTAVQPGSPAAQQGLQPGDKILKVNDMDMKGVTREEAVLFLLSLQDQINLIAQYRRDEYDQIVSLQRGDSFYIKAHFNYEEPEKGEMSFRKSDVFHVVDTLHNGVVGSWQVFRMDPFLSGLGRAAEQVQKGVIPNKARGEELATQQFNAAKKEQNSLEQSRGTSFFRRKRDKSAHHRRSKSLGKDHWEDLVWSESMSKFPAYERVSLRHPGFPRPVVIFGPCADLARERLLRDYPGKFASPQLDPTDSTPSSSSKNSSAASKSGIVRLSSIRDVMNRGKHALLDVTPNAVDKLNYAQFYPIVILAKADSKQTIKEIRAGLPNETTCWVNWKAHMSSKKLLEQCQKLEKLWSHVFTSTLNLNNMTTESQWYTKLTDLIDKQQTAPIWMSESKPDQSFADDFLFPMTSRLSYASSPESDGEFCDPDPTPRMMSRNPSLSRDVPTSGLARSTSDPNLARDDPEVDNGIIPDYNAPPPYAVSSTPAQQTSSIQPHSIDVPDSAKRRSQGGDSKYGFSTSVRKSSNEMYSSPPQTNESLDDLPLPPHPKSTPPGGNSTNVPITPNTSSGSTNLQNSSSSSSKRSQSQPPNRHSPSRTNGETGGPSLPSVPPKIDRQKKPSRRSGSSTNTSNEYIQSNGTKGNNSLERHTHIRDLKMSAYDPYDPYSTGNEINGVDPSANIGTNGNRPRSMGGQNGFYDTAPNSSQSPGARQSRAMSQDPGYRTGPGGRPLYANPPSSAMNGYESSPSSKYSTPPIGGVEQTPPQQQQQQQQRYRYSDYKPVPPPKTTVYKPVPPPKPKSYHPPPTTTTSTSNGGQRGSVPMMGIQQSASQQMSQQPSSYVPEGNYMNSGQMQSSSNGGGYATSLHYHSSQMSYDGPTSLGHGSNYGPPPTMSNGRGYDDDSGQGSSLDRDYPMTNGNGYMDRNGGYGSTGKHPPPSSANHSRGQYYYNVPPGTAPPNGTSGPSPRRSGDGLDLTNREYRGSAFELYKKPMTEARSLPPNSQHYYNQHQIGR